MNGVKSDKVDVRNDRGNKFKDKLECFSGNFQKNQFNMF